MERRRLSETEVGVAKPNLDHEPRYRSEVPSIMANGVIAGYLGEGQEVSWWCLDRRERLGAMWKLYLPSVQSVNNSPEKQIAAIAMKNTN